MAEREINLDDTDIAPTIEKRVTIVDKDVIIENGVSSKSDKESYDYEKRGETLQSGETVTTRDTAQAKEVAVKLDFDDKQEADRKVVAFESTQPSKTDSKSDPVEIVTCTDKSEDKVGKSKRKRSLFRKSKKSSLNKSKDESEKKTEKLENQVDYKTEENKQNESLESPETSPQKQQAVGEKRLFFRRKSSRSATKNFEEDAATQTGHDNESEGKDAMEEISKDDAENLKKKPKPRKRSIGKKLSKLRKSTKWTNTALEIKEENHDEIKFEEKENAKQSDESEDSFHDVLKPSPITENPGCDQRAVLETEEKIEASSSEKTSMETVIVHSDSELQSSTENKIESIKVPESSTSDNNALNEHYNETCESQFTNVTPLPDTIFKTDTPSNCNMHVEERSKDNENAMEEINLSSDNTFESNTSLTGSKPDPTEISRSDKETLENLEDKKKALGFLLVDQVNENQKDQSFVIAKKAAKAYENARLNKTYCQACCTVM